MNELEAATELTRVDENVWRTTLLQSWALWGPAGGYLTSLVLRAASADSQHKRPVSLACQFVRVARFEPVDLVVEQVRVGKRSELREVTMRQEGKTILRASLWFTAPEAKGMEHDFTVQDLPDRTTLPTYEDFYPDRQRHPIGRRFEQRLHNAMPDGDLTPREPEMTAWFRFHDEGGETMMVDDPCMDYIRAMVLLDTFSWLATYPAHPAPGPSPWIAPNLDIYFRFHRTTHDSPWLYMKNRADLAHDSLITTDSHLYNERGELCVSSGAQHLCSRRPEQFK